MSDIIPFGNHPVFRFLLGWALPPRIALLKYFETETTKNMREKFHLVQDMLMPVKKLKESLLYFHEHYCIYPIWLSPMSIYSNPLKAGFIHPLVHQEQTDELFVDIGAYGIPQVKNFDGNTALKNLEQFVLSNEGYQAPYARTLLSLYEFRKMFDHTSYDVLRERMPLCREAFGEVYDKISARVAPVQFRKK